MFLILQVATVLLVAIAMSLALAHALEFPGKRRLDQETYRAVQTIYYPGFTYGGFSEWLGIIAVLALLLATPTWSARFTCTLVALICLVSMHGVYWVITHPVNRFWLKETDLKDLGGKFFAFDPLKRQIQENLHDEGMWRKVARSVGILACRPCSARHGGTDRSAGRSRPLNSGGTPEHL